MRSASGQSSGSCCSRWPRRLEFLLRRSSFWASSGPGATGGGPGILALRILFALSYIAVMITCFSPDTKRVKTCYFLQRLQISERAFLLWDALAAALCFLLFYCAQILTVFGLACVYQRSAGYALGPQGVFLMLARDSFLHGLLPFGESVIWDAQHPLHGLRGGSAAPRPVSRGGIAIAGAHRCLRWCLSFRGCRSRSAKGTPAASGWPSY